MFPANLVQATFQQVSKHFDGKTWTAQYFWAQFDILANVAKL